MTTNWRTRSCKWDWRVCFTQRNYVICPTFPAATRSSSSGATLFSCLCTGWDRWSPPLQDSSQRAGEPRVPEAGVPRNLHLLHLRVQDESGSQAAKFPTWSTVHCTTSPTPRLNVPPHFLSDLVLYPPLHPGDRVIRGPDWQWANKDGNGEGTVVCIKEWKGVPNKGVRVKWDVGDENVYRYGADDCYDVCE